jgi:hypothetical protein
MRLTLRHRLSHATPSFRLITFIRQDDPAPWLHPHCDTQRLPSYYGRVRQRAPRRYSPPCGFRRLEFSLSPPTTRQPCRGTPSHVPYESPDRAHAACTPDTTWAVNG